MEWSPVQSVITQVINKIRQTQSWSMICSSGVRLQTELDSSQSYYQLIKTIVQREKLDVTYTFLLQKQQLTEQNARQQDA